MIFDAEFAYQLTIYLSSLSTFVMAMVKPALQCERSMLTLTVFPPRKTCCQVSDFPLASFLLCFLPCVFVLSQDTVSDPGVCVADIEAQLHLYFVLRHRQSSPLSEGEGGSRRAFFFFVTCCAIGNTL